MFCFACRCFSRAGFLGDECYALGLGPPAPAPAPSGDHGPSPPGPSAPPSGTKANATDDSLGSASLFFLINYSDLLGARWRAQHRVVHSNYRRTYVCIVDDAGTWFFASIAAHLHRRLRFVPKSSAAAITDAGLRRYGPGRVITLQGLSSPRDLLRNRKSTNLSPSRCVFHDFFLYVLASATYSLSYTLGFRIFYKDTMKCISMYCYREGGKTYVYSMHESTHISQYNLCSCW